MIEALVFDFDGLILDTETPIIQAWEEVHQRAGVTYSRAHALSVVGHVDMEFDPWVAFGPAADRVKLETEHKTLTREILQRQQILPGIQDYLDGARQRGFRLAIASNSPHAWVDRHLKRLGLWERFDLVRCRDDVERGKPEPDVYQAVLTAFKIEGRNAIAFEDSYPGSIAAKRAGLWCVTVPNPSTHHHEFDHADLRLPSLAELSLEALLARFAGKMP
jgi:putative hydrolase of the HAD superfamily